MNLPGRGNYRYYLVTILSVTWMIIYLQRTNIGMLLVDNRFLENMNLLGQPAQQGLLMTVFLLAYSLANILLVSISNRLGPRRTLMWGIVVGSMILMLGGWAATFAAIIAVRLLLGITHGIQYPNLSVLVKNWFPPHERGTANAIYAMGGCIGPALAIPLYGWLNQSWGWEYSFFVPAAFGLACVIPFFLKWVSDQPGDNSYISDKEVRYIISNQRNCPAEEDSDQRSPGISQVLKNQSFWLLCIAYAAFNCSWWGLLTWIPQYLVQARHFEMSGMTSYVTVAYMVAMVGVFTGGRLVDYVPRKSIVGLAALLGVALATFGISATSSPMGAVICIVLAVGINEFVFPTVWAILQGITPGKLMAAGSGMISGTANLVSAMTPFLMGFLIQITGSYASGLMFLVGMALLGALSCWVLLRQGH